MLTQLVVIVLWVIIPGAAIAWALRLRGSWWLLLAPALTVGIISGLAVLLGAIGMPFTGVSIAGIVAFAAAIVWLVGTIWCRRQRGTITTVTEPLGDTRTVTEPLGDTRTVTEPPGDTAAVTEKPKLWERSHLIWIGVALAALIQGLSTYQGMGNPFWFPQNSDTPFHLNVVRFILNNQNASSAFVDTMFAGEAGDPIGMYPAAWHGIVSLGVIDSIVLASNAMVLTVTALIWPISIAAFALAMWPHRPLIAAVTPIVSSAYLSFPNRFFTAGVLWPQALAYSIIPAALAATIILVKRKNPHRISWGLALAAVLVGIVLAQPSGLLVYGVIATPLVIFRAFAPLMKHRNKTYNSAQQLVRIIGPIFAAAGWVIAWSWLFFLFSQTLHPGTTVQTNQGVRTGIWLALSDAAFSTSFLRSPSIPIAITTIIGVVIAFWHHRTRWVPFSLFGLLALAGIMTGGGPISRGLSWLVYPFFADEQRILATIPLVASPLIALTIVTIADKIANLKLRQIPMRVRNAIWFAPVLTLGLTVIFGITTNGFQFQGRIETLNSNYVAPLTPGTNISLVTLDELALLERLGDSVSPGGIVFGDPLSGIVLAPAISDVSVIYDTLGNRSWLADVNFLTTNLHRLPIDPRVCEALERLGIEYFYHDTETNLHWRANNQDQRFSRLRFGNRPWLTPLDSGGTATLYRITGCD